MYCNKTDLINRFGEDELISLTDRANTGAIADLVIDQAMLDASAEIDGYLGGRYDLPLTTVPDLLKRLACNVARYNLYDEQENDRVTKLYDDGIKFLKSVAKGEISLGISTVTGAKAQSNDCPQMESAGSVFGRKQSQGFI